MNKAIFFDRDGTLVKLIYRKDINIYSGPWNVNELDLYDIINISKLKNYLLFLVTNQSDVRKGYPTSMKNLMDIHSRFHNILESKNIHFTEYYYCFHNDEDNCICRKPSPYFLLEAAKKYNVNLSESWMIGDRDKDMKCGKLAGCKTIKITKMNNLENTIKKILNYTE